LLFHDKNSVKPLESLSRDEVDTRITFVAPSHDYDELRVVDIYQRIGIEAYCKQSEKTIDQLNEFELMMLSIPDALLEKELFVHADILKKTQKDRSNWFGYDHPEEKNMIIDDTNPVFPVHMFDQIHTFRQMRNTLVEQEVRPRGTSYASLVADEPIGHLSTGMKLRFLFELNKELHAQNNDAEQTRVFIFDEPFAQLDPTNTREYLEQINDMLNEPNPPVVILVAHKEGELIKEVLKDKVLEATFDS
jgi:hypothetical protein